MPNTHTCLLSCSMRKAVCEMRKGMNLEQHPSLTNSAIKKYCMEKQYAILNLAKLLIIVAKTRSFTVCPIGQFNDWTFNSKAHFIHISRTGRSNVCVREKDQVHNLSLRHIDRVVPNNTRVHKFTHTFRLLNEDRFKLSSTSEQLVPEFAPDILAKNISSQRFQTNLNTVS